ncbi:hypothetical protein PUNSTDRAFT_49230 [Punctularia strigosozonata HHB-11173 SS5]|uniref:uncharacterized protein n=1 Tax=Punctularia strigosozonata (strain HHB-11173) TaxID=741275 RepID=UPI00044170DE|nr:uncharacterized protein PUNSTDRAFT_49230 [Punctularia strigosozonata HHB-11173 SS5]EIN14442.1 hypothetical protein PUNSTDRAFT_49230 [Punctularia strigosozonata HHB-11173 SS5]
MILIEDKKYACETCIKGHRSSACKHTERPLFEIKKKGRPVTQCEHCRELRKTKQVHVKCICEAPPADRSTEFIKDAKGQIKKVSKKLPQIAAFPHGLPGAKLTAKQEIEKTCLCKAGETCHCFSPRRPANGRRASVSDTLPSGPSHAELLAKANFRHVLPRPTPALAAPQPRIGPVHDLSSNHLGHGARHYSTHDNLFSPYGRAYEYARSTSDVNDHGSNTNSDSPPSRESPSNVYPESATPLSAMDTDPAVSWPGSNMDLTTVAHCGCGMSCACPGCLEHGAQPSATSNAFDTCVNPESCASCLQCSVNTLAPMNLPSSDTHIPNFDYQPSDYQPMQVQQIFDWLESVPAQTPHAYPPIAQPDNTFTIYAQQTWSAPELPTTWPQIQQTLTSDKSSCCGDGCSCAPGQCSCDGHGRLTFATSGMRAACCAHGEDNVSMHSSRSRSVSSSSGTESAASYPGSADVPLLLSGGQQYYDYAVSTSSESSLSRSPSIASLQSLQLTRDDRTQEASSSGGTRGYPLGDRQRTLMPDHTSASSSRGYPLGDRQRTLMPDQSGEQRSIIQRAKALVRSVTSRSSNAPNITVIGPDRGIAFVPGHKDNIRTPHTNGRSS